MIPARRGRERLLQKMDGGPGGTGDSSEALKERPGLERQHREHLLEGWLSRRPAWCGRGAGHSERGCGPQAGQEVPTPEAAWRGGVWVGQKRKKKLSPKLTFLLLLYTVYKKNIEP